MQTRDMTIGMHVEVKAGQGEAFVFALRTQQEAAAKSYYSRQETVGLAVRSYGREGTPPSWFFYWKRPHDVIRPWSEKLAEDARRAEAAAARAAAVEAKRQESFARIKSWGIKPVALCQALGIGPEESMRRSAYDYNKSKRQGLYRGERVSVYVDLGIIQALVDLARSTEAPVPVPDDALDHFLRSMGIEV